MDLLGDIGGVTEIFMIIFGTLFSSWTFHTFILKALELLYVAKTKQKNLFKQSEQTLQVSSIKEDSVKETSDYLEVRF